MVNTDLLGGGSSERILQTIFLPSRHLLNGLPENKERSIFFSGEPTQNFSAIVICDSVWPWFDLGF
jgi:hypothetical protein